jgi:hypothetical protein
MPGLQAFPHRKNKTGTGAKQIMTIGTGISPTQTLSVSGAIKKRRRKMETKPTPTQIVFLCSKVNGAFYSENLLPECNHIFEFPRKTWLSMRREEIRKEKRKPNEKD